MEIVILEREDVFALWNEMIGFSVSKQQRLDLFLALR